MENNKFLFLKGSFEDEGLTFDEVQILSAVARQHNLSLAFKIGGCEAKSDISQAANLGAKCVVAPMVESVFAVTKFIDAVKQYDDVFEEININIETVTAANNAAAILKEHQDNIKGVVVGRTDLSLSLGLTKGDVDSPEVMGYVEKVLKEAKSYGLVTTMGGSVSINSIPCIIDMHKKGLLDRFETRKVIIEASSEEKVLEEQIREAMKIEIDFLERSEKNSSTSASNALLRIQAIKKRIGCDKDDAEYKKQFAAREDKVIAIDFDGVIHDHCLGFHDGTIYGDALPDSLAALKELHDMGYAIVVHSCKLHPDRPLVNNKTGKELVCEWLESKGVAQYVSDVVWGKPHALAYIDDKAIAFDSWTETLEIIKNIK
jgi:hypothetical protein